MKTASGIHHSETFFNLRLDRFFFVSRRLALDEGGSTRWTLVFPDLCVGCLESTERKTHKFVELQAGGDARVVLWWRSTLPIPICALCEESHGFRIADDAHMRLDVEWIGKEPVVAFWLPNQAYWTRFAEANGVSVEDFNAGTGWGIAERGRLSFGNVAGPEQLQSYVSVLQDWEFVRARFGFHRYMDVKHRLWAVHLPLTSRGLKRQSQEIQAAVARILTETGFTAGDLPEFKRLMGRDLPRMFAVLERKRPDR